MGSSGSCGYAGLPVRRRDLASSVLLLSERHLEERSTGRLQKTPADARRDPRSASRLFVSRRTHTPAASRTSRALTPADAAAHPGEGEQARSLGRGKERLLGAARGNHGSFAVLPGVADRSATYK